jgi:hypothetical protein
MIQEMPTAIKCTQNRLVSQAAEILIFTLFLAILEPQLNHIEVKVEVFGIRKSAS